MTSSVGLELDLTWKTVSKGNRSGTRRTRKSIAKKSIGGVQPSDGNSRPAEDCTVSESEKLGLVVLGHRFNEKIEHIPIKKRRFLFRSPSPPPSPQSSLVDISEQHKVIQCTSGQTSYSNPTQVQKITEFNILTKPTAIASDETLLEVKNEKVGCMEDFSGIEMLAAAACNGGVDDYADNSEEKNSQEDLEQERNEASLASLIPSELSDPKDSGTTVPLKTDVSFSKDSGNEVKIEESCLLPAEDSGNEVRMEDLSLVTQKDSGKVVKMEDPSLLLTEEAENEVKTDDLSVPDNAIAVLHKNPVPSYTKAGETSISVPDDRSLWDLNLSIDAWETPCDSRSDDSKNNVLGNTDVDKDAVLQNKDFHDLKKDSMDEAFSSDVGQDTCLPSDLGPFPSGTEGLNETDLEGKRTSSLIGKDNKHVQLRADNAADFVQCIADNADASARLVGIDQFSSPRSAEVNITSLVVVKQETVEIAPSSSNVELGTMHCASVAEAGKYICNKIVKPEQDDVASSCAPVLEMAVKDVECKVCYNDGKPHGGDSVFHDDKVSDKGLKICGTEGKAMPKTEPASGMEDKGICQSSSRCGDMLALGSSVIVDDIKGQSGGAPSSADYEIGTSAVMGSEKTSESGKNGHPSSHEKVIVSDSCNQSPMFAATTAAIGFAVAHEAGSNVVNDPCSQRHTDPASQDKAFIGGRQSCLDLQTGYDSQFEDGELRESDAPWEEIEQVDYDTEGEEERLSGLDAENSEEKSKIERGLSPGSDGIIESKICDMQDDLRDNSVSLKVATEAVVEGSGTAISFVDGIAVKDPHSALDGPRTIKRELVEASQSFDAVEISRSNYCDGASRQVEKDAGPEELPCRSRSLYIHGRRAGADPCISHSASQNSTIYYGPNSSLRSRPNSAAESRSETADVLRTENDMGSQFMSSHSNGMYRPFVRRRSPADRDDSYGMRTRMATLRDTTPDRTRFRRYPQGVHSGVREEQGYIPDDTSRFIRRVPSSDGEERSRTGSFVDSYAQSERESCSDKFIGRDRPATRMRGRSAGGGQYYNHSGGIRNEYIKHATDDVAEYISHLPSSNALRRNRSDDFDVSYPQAERGDFDKFTGRERPTSRVRGRSPRGGQIFNPSAGYWDSKRQHSPSHQGAYHAACPRPKSAMEGRRYVEGQTLPEAASMTRRPDNRINRPFMSSPSNEGYRPYMRRRSPVERDDCFGMHTRMTTVRDGSPPDRNRFRRYPQGVGRGVRNDYLRHDPDEATEYSNRLPRRVVRRERSISPESYYAEPFKKTRSRSRSRSPMGFLVQQRDRNDGGPRRQSRPDFRSDGRIDRVRLFPRRFPAEYGDGFISPPRGRMSPPPPQQNSSRVFEDGNSGLDHMRGRKSPPVRMFRET